ncbi:hypothetical protein A8B75_16790 [Sphingomonadales bacterium EhC05]|nr:hypothetical protein A8B75_16790 [Sphingomonadales bacterium EhC05]PHR18018.1 MAG: hypothetical protein COA41_10805 [Sphingopyxis sp.]
MSNISTSKQIFIWGWTLSLFLLVSYLICIGFGVLAPQWAHMHEAWAPWLPGFKWLTWPGFFAGAVGSFAYGWYIALFGIPLKRFIESRIGNTANG